MKKTISELWIEIFKDFNVLEKIRIDGYFIISANDIRKYKEPRLMAKFDFSKQLPKIFKDNNLGILPIRNGEYIIGKFNMFEKIPDYENILIKNLELPRFIETIDPDNIYSECNALNVAMISGMLDDALDDKFYETIQGKMRANRFQFWINNNLIEVNGAAMEVDGGYESSNKIVLVEAKNTMPEDFVIRQLYYPYRHWKDKVLKDIIPVFFAYENGIYNFFIYEFENINDYNSLKLVNIKRYIITNKTSEHLKLEIFKNVEIIEELSQDVVPFPQADKFSKVLGTLEYINSGINTARLISEEFGFDVRQGKYYIDALRYLKLIKKSNNYGEYELTALGIMACNSDSKTRNALLVEEILKHEPFYKVYKAYLNNDIMPNKIYIREILKNKISELSTETINRRASTIRSWIQWIIGCQI